ncbi:DNA mismatch repair endonuclease MutL [Candidatus Jidaibacter acanthamoebae]|nr:DNA mismatch repair endonuclease MutL [Candidatus Jidaibacter acanthamoeba]
MKIKRLTEKTINRIAAGEVIERPLSVIKELVENSIDAGAKNIVIEIERGGRNLIIITDDGEGITKDDLLLAIERHATSKLSEDDICNINFHGFRGEALPSIASVSRMKITSRHITKDEAWQIEVLGGEVQNLVPAGLKQGTVVEVRDLFYFTPNRLKFLKSESSEISVCTDLINRFALCHANISFKFISDGRVVLNYKPNQTDLSGEDTRVGDILGADFLKNSVKVSFSRDYLSFKGYTSLPTYSRKTSVNYLTYVNRRIIRDKFFIGAVKAAYNGLIPHDRYPMIALFLEIDPYEVDVNVHPTKAEVRFKDENFIRGTLISEIRKAIAQASAPQASGEINPSKLYHPQINLLPPRPIVQSSLNINRFVDERPQAKTFSNNFNREVSTSQIHDSITDSFRSVNFEVVENKSVEKAEESSSSSDSFPLGFAKCQINNTFIISESKDGFIIVDQHAAHERLVLEKMKKAMQENRVKSQPLLVPEVVEVGAAMAEKILEFSLSLRKFGIVIERNGLSQILVREVPYLLGKLDIRGFIFDLADNISEYNTITNLDEKLDEICGNIACHSSIRAGRKLSVEEMNAILREMENTPFSSQCNHGRPTFRKLTLKELHNMFERT